MGKGLEELKRLAYENACCRCQYYIDNKCINKGECVWKTIEKELKDYKKIKDIRITARFDLDQVNKEHKALELLKRNLVIAFEEDNGIDLPTLVVGIKVSKDKLCIIYSTQDKEEIRILKEVLYENN